MRSEKTILLLIMLMILTIIMSCGSSKPARFYTLTSVPAGEISAFQSAYSNDVTIGIGVVDLPEYLERPQIVTHLSANELNFAEYERWAEPLKDNFTRVLLENLSMMIPSDNIYMVPWKDYEPNTYQVILEIIRFERQTDKNVFLQVRWSILQGESKHFLLTRKSEFREPAANESYADIVAAMSRTIGSLSKEIASEISNLANNKN